MFVKFVVPGLFVLWHRLDHAARGASLKPEGRRKIRPEVPETHDDEVVRGNDQRGLPARARHVIGIARDWILPFAVEARRKSP